MRNPKERREVPWWDRYGTVSGVEGNLPEYKITECVDTVIDLSAIHAGGAVWVKNTDFHFYHMKCPYGIYTITGFFNPAEYDSAAFNYVRNTNPASPNYWKMEQVLPANRSVHNATGGMMIRHSRGSRHGWMCVDPNCSYFLSAGNRYFYL